MSVEKMREEFEAWALSENLSSEQKHWDRILGWQAWQAGRAALVAEFEAKKLAVSDDHDDWAERECWNNGITACQCIADPSIVQVKS